MSEEIKEEELTQGPTDAQIDAWKKSYGDIYMITLVGGDYYYRPLTRHEFRTISKVVSPQSMGDSIQQNLAFEESIVQIAVLFPAINQNNIMGVNAGVVGTLSNLIMEASGFDEMAQPTKL